MKQIKRVSVGNSEIRGNGYLSLSKVQDSAVSALSDINFKELYEAVDIDADNKSMDAAFKTVLANKLAESVIAAHTYARKRRLKNISAATILVASQQNRW